MLMHMQRAHWGNQYKMGPMGMVQYLLKKRKGYKDLENQNKNTNH